jgi:hypothetical protein
MPNIRFFPFSHRHLKQCAYFRPYAAGFVGAAAPGLK